LPTKRRSRTRRMQTTSSCACRVFRPPATCRRMRCRRRDSGDGRLRLRLLIQKPHHRGHGVAQRKRHGGSQSLVEHFLKVVYSRFSLSLLFVGQECRPTLTFSVICRTGVSDPHGHCLVSGGSDGMALAFAFTAAEHCQSIVERRNIEHTVEMGAGQHLVDEWTRVHQL
jgi:hypothetical protein